MPKDQDQPPHAGEQDFREAVAQWRLAVRTEVKRASSLPSAMFDASDPMLEMQLAGSTEDMLAQLLMPDPHLSAESDEIERHLESIGSEELRQLPDLIAARPSKKVDLLSNLTGEYLGILADSCCMQSGIARQRAVDHICADFGVEADNLDEVLEELHRLTLEADDDKTSRRDRQEIDRVVEQVAAALRDHFAGTDTSKDPA